jgi:peptide/nickel transport system substrate-binding protein
MNAPGGLAISSRNRITALLCLALVALVAGCNSGDSGSGKEATDKTLRLGYYEDIQSPDPDVQYDIPGLELVNNVYEGLVHYEPGDSTKIVPWLATDWTVSPDKSVYEFDLREGVTFHDGTKFDSAAAKASLERRIAMKQGTFYQVQDIKSIETPSPSKLKITLKGTNAAFMSYLASPYGVKMISPTAIAKNTKGDKDMGQAYLGKNDAGTGPYTLSEFSLGQRYVAKAYPKWWGEKPFYETVVFKLIPDSGSQVLQLKGGDLDILHQQPITTLDSLKDDSNFQVQSFPVVLKSWVHVNPNRPPFDDPEVRRVLGQAFDREKITKTFFGEYATVSTQMYPAGLMPEGLAEDPQPFDPSKLKAAVAGLPADQRKVELVYLSGHGADIQRIAGELGNELRNAGLEPDVHEVTVAQLFGYPAQDATKVPQLFVGNENSDSGHPDTWSRSYMYKGSALDYLRGTIPAADAAMDVGIRQADEEKEVAAYAKAGDIIHDEGTFITIADLQDTFLARAGITGFEHQLECPTCLNLAALKADE